MNLSKTTTIISIAVASMVGAAGYAYAQQTGAQQSDSSTSYSRDGTRAGANNPAGANAAAGANTSEGAYSPSASNPNVPSAGVSGAVGDTSGSTSTSDSSRMNSDGTMRDRTTGERKARADRN